MTAKSALRLALIEPVTVSRPFVLALVHLRLVHRPQRLDVGGRVEPGEATDVLGVHDLQVGQVMPTARAAVPRAGGRDRVPGRA